MAVVNKFDHSVDTAPKSMIGKLPVNVRTINGVDLKVVKVNKADGKNLIKTPYEV